MTTTTTHGVLGSETRERSTSRPPRTHAVRERDGAPHTLCDGVEPAKIDLTALPGPPTCKRCLALLAAPRKAPPVDRVALRALAAEVLDATQPPAPRAHALARQATALLDEMGPAKGRPRKPKTSPDAVLIERVIAARGCTMSALAAEVGVGVSVLSRADATAIPPRVRGLLLGMLERAQDTRSKK